MAEHRLLSLKPALRSLPNLQQRAREPHSAWEARTPASGVSKEGPLAASYWILYNILYKVCKALCGLYTTCISARDVSSCWKVAWADMGLVQGLREAFQACTRNR